MLVLANAAPSAGIELNTLLLLVSLHPSCVGPKTHKKHINARVSEHHLLLPAAGCWVSATC
jgi:hypothetical protein